MHADDSMLHPSAPLETEDSSNDPDFMILVAEDNAVNQKVSLLQLKKLGFAAIAVSNGKAALDEVTHKDYAVVLMDCQMPEMDGFEATHAIRKEENLSGKHVPIIGLTAHAMEGDRDRCIAAGMDDYLSKPTSLEKLDKMLRKWIPEETRLERKRKFSAASASNDGDSAAQPEEEKEPSEDNGKGSDRFAQLTDFEDVLPPEMVSELIPLFIDSTGTTLNKIEKALSQRDASPVAELAHELKSAAAGVGAAKVSAISTELELSAKQENWVQMKKTFDKLRKAFDRFREEVQRTKAVAVQD